MRQDAFRSRAGRCTAAAALFPELARRGSAAFAEGLLRAPNWGRVTAPLLSAWACGPGLPPGASGVEEVLETRGWETAELLARAAAGRRSLVAARVGGEWWQEDGERFPAGRQYVLAEAAADGVAESDSAVDRALAENAADRVVILAPRRAGKRLRERAAAAGACFVEGPVNPWAALDGAARVYTDGGELGFLALIAGREVSACGGAYYAGWGATDDGPGVQRRRFKRSVDEIFAAACLVATRYRDPFRNASTTFEEALAILADWRRVEVANRQIAVCVGMSFWKRRRVADFLRSSAGKPVFRRSVAGALAAARAKPGAIAGWASRLPAGLVEAAAECEARLLRVEDGFIRSVGLGSDFLPPASLVFDANGMYYDPRGESDLERLLRDAVFDPALLARAERLAGQLVTRGITKYNLAAGAPGIVLPPDRRVILVPGQVEDDLSIVFGSGEVRGNLALLERVRADNPEAYVVYKPHPDVLAGHRVGAVAERDARRFADAIVTGGAMSALLERADELHTMTSLSGFEALLRGRRVVVYGRPFYAGWGLTRDMPGFDRGRRLSLAELVAGALIFYPRYLDPLTRLPCGPEVIIERLDRPELWRAGPLVAARRLQGRVARRLRERRPGAPLATAVIPGALRGEASRSVDAGPGAGSGWIAGSPPRGAPE